MAEKLAVSSSQRFGLTLTLFAQSIVFLGKKIERFNVLAGDTGREKREERNSDRCWFWVLRMGVGGHGLDILALIYSQGRTVILTNFRDLIKVNFLYQSFMGVAQNGWEFTRTSWDFVSENVDLT